MDQTNSLVMNMLQSMANQAAGIPKTGKSDGDQLSDFQKLLDEKAQEKDPLVEQPPKTQAPAKKTEKAPAQKQESALERAKKLAEQGAWFTQPDIRYVDIDLTTGEVLATYEPGEYILAHIGERTEIIPTTDLEPAQMLELKNLLDDMGQVLDVSDPLADALLEATAPGADNSAAALLEKVVDEKFGQVARQAVEEVQPQDEDEQQVEIVDVEQAPQRVFHDVKAAPVKVGETENAQQADEPDVAQQVDAAVAQALQRGESTVTVRLNPENLGEVTVQVSVKDNGVMAVAISARSDDTRALLERHSANLQELLSSRVRETVEVNVQRGQESQQNQQQNYDGRNGHAQQEQRERRQRQEHTSPEDFMQQLRLGLIPADGDI